MDNDEQKLIIIDNLRKIGIMPQATAIYIELAQLGSSSALQLAKQTKVTRTQVYRHLETLQQYGLVSAEQLSYGTLFRAQPIANIEGIIIDREAEMTQLKKSLTSMTDSLQQLLGNNSPKATVQHYYGIDGLKQANWNLTKANGEYRVFETAHLSLSSLGKRFAQRCYEREIDRGLTSYDLTNITSLKAAEIEPYDPTHSFHRHIDPSILSINFEAYIYNDVVTLLDYSKNQQMALEIHHPALNAMMTQLFDAMWLQAVPLEIKTD